MELAYREFDEVRVVPLPPATDPADDRGRFAERLEAARSRTRATACGSRSTRARAEEEAFKRVQEFVAAFDRNTEWQDAVEYAADRLDLPRETPARARARVRVAATGAESPARCSRRATASSATRSRACVAHPELARLLAELDARALRRPTCTGACGPTSCSSGAEPDAELVALLAELDARAAAEGIDEATGQGAPPAPPRAPLRRELATAEPERTRELQEQRSTSDPGALREAPSASAGYNRPAIPGSSIGRASGC